MKRSPADVVDSLWQRIMMTMPGQDGETCVDYLRTAWQKRLFAAERLKSLSEHVGAYKNKLDSRQVLDSLPLAMDYDHLLISLRGSLSNTANLIGAILLYDRDSRPAIQTDAVSLRAVTDDLERSVGLKSGANITELVRYLKTELDEPWYKELLEPTVIISHDKSRGFSRISPRTLNEQLLDFGFLLHDMAGSAGQDESSIITYCRNMIQRVEKLEAEVFLLLNRCL